MIRGSEFIYAGKYSRDFGVRFVAVKDETMFVKSGGDYEIITGEKFINTKRVFYGRKYTAPLEFPVEICVTDTNYELSADRFAELKDWLFGQRKYQKLEIFNKEAEDYYYNCVFLPNEDIIGEQGYFGVRCTLLNISPFVFSDPVSKSWFWEGGVADVEESTEVVKQIEVTTANSSGALPQIKFRISRDSGLYRGELLIDDTQNGICQITDETILNGIKNAPIEVKVVAKQTNILQPVADISSESFSEYNAYPSDINKNCISDYDGNLIKRNTILENQSFTINKDRLAAGFRWLRGKRSNPQPFSYIVSYLTTNNREVDNNVSEEGGNLCSALIYNDTNHSAIGFEDLGLNSEVVVDCESGIVEIVRYSQDDEDMLIPIVDKYNKIKLGEDNGYYFGYLKLEKGLNTLRIAGQIESLTITYSPTKRIGGG